jgi:hypothetical protein
MEFKLSNEEIKKAKSWITSQEKTKEPPTAIGGRFSFNFTITSIGVVVVVKDNFKKEELDVTDYSHW